MISLADALSPTRQNPNQRKGFFTSLAIATLILLLHFPFDGYDTDDYVITSYGYGSCPNQSIEEWKNATPEQFNQEMEDTKRCSDQGEMRTRPFTQWKSKGSIYEWFSSVAHAITALVFTLSLGGIWLWVFRTHDND